MSLENVTGLAGVSAAITGTANPTTTPKDMRRANISTPPNLELSHWKTVGSRLSKCQELSPAFLALAELIGRGDRFSARKVDFQQLFALDRHPLLVGKPRHNLLAGDVDDVAGRGKRRAPVDAERHPSGLVAQFH